MSKRSGSSLGIAIASALIAVVALLPASAAAAKAPRWKLSATSQPTNFTPGSSGKDAYLLVATNVGAAPASGEITITDTLPVGFAPASTFTSSGDPATAAPSCTTAGQEVSCKTTGPLHSGFSLSVQITVNVTAPEESLLSNKAEVKSEGTSAAIATSQTAVKLIEPEFDFLPGEEGFRAPVVDEEGAPPSESGSHEAYEGITDFGFPTVAPGGFLTGAGHLRDLRIELPRGMLANPATPTRCTEAELTSVLTPGCPDSSQVGTVTVTTVVGVFPTPQTTAFYSMVSPPGTPALFGFNALGVGIFPHLSASIRSESDYGASGISRDILARGLNPVLNVGGALWGDPSGEDHDLIRECQIIPPCEITFQPDTFLALPGDCPHEALTFRAFADSWEEPFPQFEEREATYQSAGLEGKPVQISGCGGMEFEPSIAVKPTTNVTDSPSGLDFDLKQPQNFKLGARSTAVLKDARVTLPEGLAVNASQADGLAVCSSAQAGMLTAVGEAPAHFSNAPSSCPDASKIGTVEVTSPLLARYNEKNEVQRDPETGEVIPEPLHGSVFVAKPFDNPFNSLLAIYLAVEDPQTGIFAKLASKVEPDPVTGQLTTRLSESPELPLSEAKIHLFSGPRSPLQTPPTCGSHTTTATLTPWSAPEAPDVGLADSFATTAAPGGGPCPATLAAAPNSPSLLAGTLNPKAATYSPLVAKLARPDGSQRLSRIETTLPPGLTGKLAGVGQCSEAQIAAAKARSQPNEGALEQASPSCPASSQVGVVDVGAGAGPSPFHIQGNLYLAGPYKGAPLSFVTITPAIAGPFDLGTVVVRLAAYLDPTTAQVRAVSDPLPQILQGIPVDVRSVAVQVDRPNFTLNPTSCDPLATTGAATSPAGSLAALSDPFQVGGCSALKYKPKLTIRLFGPVHRGGHPRLRSVFTAKPGEANTARIVVALPRSEFIDQAHFRTICTRVQFAAGQCPAGSVYGHVKATSPLVDYPVEGPIYLRSSSHQLPDAVAVLRGPPSQPIEIDLVGRVDSVNGGVRTTFETVPDQPVSKAIVTLQGAKKGLFQNSTNICKGIHRATVRLTGQNGKVANLSPQMKADCPKAAKPKRGGRRR